MDGPSSGVVPSGVSIGVPGAEAEFERRGFDPIRRLRL